MNSTAARTGAALAALALAACGEDVPLTVPLEPLAHSFARSEWSAPVHLVTLSSASRELGPQLSPDGLSLYFGSDRPGGFGGLDLYVARRACVDCDWGAPVNLGANINSPTNEGEPVFSPDGHLLFFGSHRQDGLGSSDIWVSRRTDTRDDFAWGPAVNLAEVNTAEHETPGSYIPALNGDGGSFYYSAGADDNLDDWDIHQVAMGPDGEVHGHSMPVAELNSTRLDTGAKVRGDGREVVFWSTRPGGPGGADLWTATRRSVAHPWSEPVSLDELNTPRADLTPGLSFDGRTLVFVAAMAARPSLGRQDIWISTRTPSGQ